MSVDQSEMYRLIADLGQVAGAAVANTRTAIEVSARHIKDDWADAAAGKAGRSLSGYPRSIDYDIVSGLTTMTIEATIGPNLGKRQGRFGAVEDAPGGWRSRPHSLRDQVLKANLADLERGLAKAVADGLG